MATTSHQKARVMTPTEVEQDRQRLPDSWKKAAGMFKRKRNALERHATTIRQEWNAPARQQ